MPIVAHDGDYITEDDVWDESAQMELVATAPDGVLAAELPMRQILRRDPATEKFVRGVATIIKARKYFGYRAK